VKRLNFTITLKKGVGLQIFQNLNNAHRQKKAITNKDSIQIQWNK